jgi:hypothetical protein
VAGSSAPRRVREGESDQPDGERPARIAALSRVFARPVPGRVLEHAVDGASGSVTVPADEMGTRRRKAAQKSGRRTIQVAGPAAARRGSPGSAWRARPDAMVRRVAPQLLIR